MSTFRIQNAFRQCLCSLDAGNSHKVTESFFLKKFDKSCCAWDKGFFLQLYLVECDFSKNRMDPCELSHVAITSVPGAYQEIKRRDGTAVSLPIFEFTIYLNREIFNSNPNDDVMRIFRARCIAHELLIVEEYANTLGTQSESSQIELPRVDPPDGYEEDAVLCPWERIEEFLHNIETTHGGRLNTNAEFIASLPTAAGIAYCDMWLKQCVEKLTCVERTSLYLLWFDRKALDDKMSELLRKLGFEYRLPAGESAKDTLKFRIKTHASFRQLVEQFKDEIGVPVDDSYVLYLACRVIDKRFHSP